MISDSSAIASEHAFHSSAARNRFEHNILTVQGDPDINDRHTSWYSITRNRQSSNRVFRFPRGP
jgi:hypothetical protein